jgi:hypothetical protein
MPSHFPDLSSFQYNILSKTAILQEEPQGSIASCFECKHPSTGRQSVQYVWHEGNAFTYKTLDSISTLSPGK